MVEPLRRPIEPGEIAPFYIGITNKGLLYSSEAQAGRPAVWVLAGPLAAAHTTPLIAAFDRGAAAFKEAEADVAALTTDNAVAALEYTIAHRTGLMVTTDAAQFMAQAGLTAPAVLVIDKNRIALAVQTMSAGDGDFDQAVASALAVIRAIKNEPGRDIVIQAPVLFIPNAISPAFCAELITLFENGGHFDSGFMTIDRKGASILKIDHKFKRRSDHFVQPGHPMHERIMGVVGRRIAPEIKKAFHIDVAHCERFLIAAYDESGGYFRRHRDDTGEANAHRQFAITLNLNTENYEGGALMFPEYGPHRYRPATGEALIFSGSLLHEALPVTKGKRYALLGFLHDAKSERDREAYRERAS